MLVDRHMTAGRAAVAWQENRPHIAGLYVLSLARLYAINEGQIWPECPHSPHKCTQTGRTPLEVSLCGTRRCTVESSFLSSRPRGEGVDRGDVRTGPLSAVLVSLSESFQT